MQSGCLRLCRVGIWGSPCPFQCRGIDPHSSRWIALAHNWRDPRSGAASPSTHVVPVAFRLERGVGGHIWSDARAGEPERPR